MSIIDELVGGTGIPRMFQARQVFSSNKLNTYEIPDIIAAQCDRCGLGERLRPGRRIAVACGSRGIANYALIVKSLTDYMRWHGAEPFIVPAMGSHGGATAAGQLEVLHSFGLSEQQLGCPVISRMDVVEVAKTPDGRSVYLDKAAMAADGIIPVNRIKAHTSFRGPYESGLVKMLVIGLGKQKGADSCHETGFDNMREDLPVFGKLILEHAPILCGLAILENAYDETMKLAVLNAGDILADEPELLKEAKENMPRILFENVDVLIVDRAGKDISGDCMDPNITGYYAIPEGDDGTGLHPERLVCLDLTEETHGCALGVGVADVVTKRLREKIIPEMTYPNGITCKDLLGAKIPLVAENDKQAIQVALKTCTKANFDRPRVIRIQDTLHLQMIEISEALHQDAQNHEFVRVIGEADRMPFNERGNLW